MELMIKCLLPSSSWANHYLESKHTYINDEGIKVIEVILYLFLPAPQKGTGKEITYPIFRTKRITLIG